MGGRYLGVDLGTKRIGLALGDPETGVVSPLKVIDARPGADDNARAILEAAEEYEVAAIVVGLPLNMDGTEGPQARQSKSLAKAVRCILSERAWRQDESYPLVHLHDERLTLHAADHRLAKRELTHKKKKARHDAVAAQVLLESFLAAHPPPQA